MFKQWNCFLLKNKLKVNIKVSPIPVLTLRTEFKKQGKGTVRMLWTETKIKVHVPINDIAKITLAADFGDLKK